MSYSVFRANLSKSSHLFLQPGNVHISAMGKIPVCLLKCYVKRNSPQLFTYLLNFQNWFSENGGTKANN